MASKAFFPPLDNLEPTRKTLHAYAQAVGVVPRAHALAHPKWWHISLKVRPEGLVTEGMALPGGGTFALRMDLRAHTVVLYTSGGDEQTFDMRAGMTGTEFGDQILKAVGGLGLSGEYAREKFESDEPRRYDPQEAKAFFSVLVNVDQLFKKHRLSLDGEVGPVQVWPHGFDLAFEWFGTRQVKHEEHGKVETYPSQLNLGFYPGQPEPYFYSNPWPFEKDQLLSKKLPADARWFTESWEGSMLTYADLIKQENPAEKLLEYARAVYEICRPTLTA